MYPECAIASWDALVLLLDAENIEQKKKSNVYANYKLQEKAASHHMQIYLFFSEDDFYQLIGSSLSILL